MLTKATVLGAGAMGTVCAQILSSNRVHVALVARRAEQVQEILFTRENRRYVPALRLSEHVVPTVDVRAALANTEMVVSAIPCQHLREVWPAYAPHVPADALVCSTTKGIDTDTLQRPVQILRDFLPGHAIAALSGPCVALEVARCLPATVVAASEDLEVAQRVQSAFTTSWFRVYTNTDLTGVELAGAMKNVIAIAAGILDGLHAGDNAKAALVTRGLVEITRLGTALGARVETFMGLAGLGDLFTTCVSPLGRNRTFGEAIGRGAGVEATLRAGASVIEGVPTTRAVMALARRSEVEMPITRAVHEVLFEQKSPLAALTELMSRPPKMEAIG